MRLQTSAAQLRAGLSLFKGVIDRRQTIPVLTTVLMKDGRLTGTDLDCEVSVALASAGPMEGEAAIEFHSLAALAGSVDDDMEMTVSDGDKTIVVAFNGSSYRMPSIPPRDFPEFKAPQGASVEIGNINLVAALRRVAFAVCTDETRYYLNGVAFLAGPDGEAMVVATDGCRMAMLPIGFMPEGATGSILPVHAVRWMTARKAEPQRCVFDGTALRALFDYAGVSFSTKLIDGTYPDIMRVLPRDPETIFSADRTVLMRVLRRIAAFDKRSFPIAKLVGEGDALTITISDDGRDGCETVPLAGPALKPFEVWFNLNYLIEALSKLGGGMVSFKVGALGGGGPWLIGCDGDPLCIAQMPARV